MIKLRCPEDLSVKLCVHPDFDGAQFDSPIYFTCAGTFNLPLILIVF